jgi:hypothetical protein
MMMMGTIGTPVEVMACVLFCFAHAQTTQLAHVITVTFFVGGRSNITYVRIYVEHYT